MPSLFLDLQTQAKITSNNLEYFNIRPIFQHLDNKRTCINIILWKRVQILQTFFRFQQNFDIITTFFSSYT